MEYSISKFNKKNRRDSSKHSIEFSGCGKSFDNVSQKTEYSISFFERDSECEITKAIHFTFTDSEFENFIHSCKSSLSF